MNERAAKVAELLGKTVELDRRARLDDDRSTDDGVLIADGAESVDDAEGKHAFVHADVALEAGRSG